MKLPYTQAESERASRGWKASCGHHSIAAAANQPLEAVKTSGIKLCGWMNPTMVSQALLAMQVKYVKDAIPPGQHPYIELVEGNHGGSRIFRVQFEGPWMQGPVAGQYKHTHYIACLPSGIMEPMLKPAEILPHEEWWDVAEGMYKHAVRGCTGYHFTDVWKIALPSAPCAMPTRNESAE